jgi:hypothetical protein
MSENQGEKKRAEERDLAKAGTSELAKAREIKARKELADSLRLAAELRVRNQAGVVAATRDWADGLFKTKSMSGPEFENWKAEGLDIFGDKAGEAADVAREIGTKPRDGYVTVTEKGKVIARHRGGEFVFTSRPSLPWVNTAKETEIGTLPDDIEADPGDTGSGVGDDPFDDDPSGFLEGMSKKAQIGGTIDLSTIADGKDAKSKIIKRAEALKLSSATRGKVGSVADTVKGVFETTQDLKRWGIEVKVPKIARSDLIVSPDLELPPPDPATFGDDLSAPPAPPAPPAPTAKPRPTKPPKPAPDRKKSTSRETWREARARLREEMLEDVMPDAFAEAFAIKIAHSIRGWAVQDWYRTDSDDYVHARLNDLRGLKGKSQLRDTPMLKDLEMRLTPESFKALKGVIKLIQDQGHGLDRLTVEPNPGGGATIGTTDVEGGSPPVVLTWPRGKASPRDHALWTLGTDMIKNIKGRIPADRRDDPSVRKVLAAGDFAADAIPGVDIAWAPFVTAGQTGDPRSFGREFQIEAAADGLGDVIGKVFGGAGGALVRAAVKFDLGDVLDKVVDTSAVKTVKEIVMEKIGDAVGDGMRKLQAQPKEQTQKP